MKSLPAPGPAWASYRLVPAKGSALEVGWYGGHPRGIRTREWPRCQVCRSPMCHMAQINAGPWLDLGPWARMSLFICHATGGRCEDWDPTKGSNKVLLQASADDALYDGPPTVRVYRRRRLTVAPALDERAVLAEAGQPLEAAFAALQHDKLGGGAVWLQGDATPRSASTGKPLRLAAQLTTDLVSFDITPGGMAYVFVDDAALAEGEAVLLWQSG